MFRSITLLIAAVALSGCAALDMKRSVSTEDVSATKHIGVVSMLGDTFYGVSIGTTVFNNEFFSAPVPDWNVSAYATSKAIEVLQANKRQAAELDLSGVTVDKPATDKDSPIWDAAGKQGFDKLVVIRAGVSGNMRFFKPGFGLYEANVFLMTPRRCVYVGYLVNVYDVATRTSIGWEWGGGESPCKQKSSDDIPFKKQFADYDQAEQKLFRERVEKRLTDTIPYTLGELSLIPETPLGN